MTRQFVPEAETFIASGGVGGGGMGMGGGGTSRGFIQMFLVPKDRRQRSSEQIAFDLRRQLSGIPGVIVRANASGGNNQINRLMSGGQGNDSRLAVEIRGEDIEAARRIALDVRDLLQTIPGIADPRLARDEARPELAVQVDRPRAALLGLNTFTVANTIRTNVAGTIAAQFRQGGYEYPIIVRLKQEDREYVADVNDVMVNTASGVALPVKNVMQISSQLGPSQIERKNQQRMVTVGADPEIPLRSAVHRTFRSALVQRSNSRSGRSTNFASC
jgi:HAE1 family hydrophobic/amphiphilic exporter-1